MIFTAATDESALAPLFAGGWDPPRDIRDRVTAILDDVRARGDGAVIEYTQRFDHKAASVASLRVDIPSRKHARGLVPEAIAAGLELARERIADYHERQKPADIRYRTHDMTEYAFLSRPLHSIGAYVPGGSASLPSTVLMTVVPANVAGVDRIVVTTPPQADGTINPAILYACSLCDVDELYAVGGAQAIAALAYGTATIAAVDKIVGPGNVYVTEAKRQVFGICGIDGLAGPSEVLVVCDERARPDFVAAELIAQAEHDPLAPLRSRSRAVSRSREMLDAVAELVTGEFATETGREDIVASVLMNRTYLILAESDDEIDMVIERFRARTSLVASCRSVVVRSAHPPCGRDFRRRSHAGCRRRLYRGYQSHATDVGRRPVLIGPAHGRLLSHHVARRKQSSAHGSRCGNARRARRLRRPACSRTHCADANGAGAGRLTRFSGGSQRSSPIVTVGKDCPPSVYRRGSAAAF